MADTKISALTEVTAPATTDVVPVVSGGATKKLSIANLVAANLGTGATQAAAGNHTHAAAAPAAHKASHATGQSDALAASDIGAATTDHTHSTYVVNPMTAKGDLTVGATAVLTDYARNTQGATCTTSFNPALGGGMIDGNDSGSGEVSGFEVGSYFLIDLGQVRTINQIRTLGNNDLDFGWYAKSLKWEYSTDNSNWTLLTTRTNMTVEDIFTVSPAVTARYWKGTVMQKNASGCYFRTVELRGGIVAGTPARLAVGTNNQIAMADSTAANGVKWIGTQHAHVADPTGGTTVDAEARAAINAILATLEAYGLAAAS